MRVSKFIAILSFMLAAVSGTVRAQTVNRPPDYDTRILVLEEQRKAQPQDVALLGVLADSYGMGANYEKAIQVVRQILVLTGDSPEYLLRLARLYSWAGQSDAALEQLRKLGGRGGVEAEQLECQILTASRRAPDAASCYSRLVGHLKDDPAKTTIALLALARNEAWAGRRGESAQAYERYLSRAPQDRVATVELIRLQRYRGEYGPAEKLCNKLLLENPSDAEVLALKAEVLHWAGHRVKSARLAAEQAETLDPGLPEAKIARIYTMMDVGANRAARNEFAALREQVAQDGPATEARVHDASELIEKQLDESSHPEVRFPFSGYNDVDGIHDTYGGVEFSAPLGGDHQVRLNFDSFSSSAPSTSIFTAGHTRSEIREFTATSSIWAKPGISLTFKGGNSMRAGENTLRPTFELHTRWIPADRWSIELSAGREFLKCTPRAIDQDISSYQTSAVVRYAIDVRNSVSMEAGRRWWSDSNRSVATNLVFDRVLRYNKRLLVHGGALTRHDLFDHNYEAWSGFFNPDHLRRHEGYLGANGEAGRLTWELRGSGGAQKITNVSTYRPSWDVTSSIGVRMAKALRVFLSYQRRNYSLLGTEGWYQGFYITLGVRP